MRILFTFVGGAGHFVPLVPVARAAAAAGHAVAFTCAAGMVPVVERHGFAAQPTDPEDPGAPPERRPLQPVDRRREVEQLRQRFASGFPEERAARIADRCAELRPDVLVCDEVDFGCPIAAGRLGLPCAMVHVCADGFIPADLAITGAVELSPFPASLRQGAVQRFRAHDAARADGDAVYFTLGTIFSNECGDLFTRVLDGVAPLAAEVIVSVGPYVDPDELGPQPSNVRVERHVDQAEVLPRCRAVISHGGSGSVLAALAHGLPSLLLPVGADQPWNADRCEELGVARVLDVVAATPADVREAVAGLDALRTAAEGLREEIARLPGPEQVVGVLEAYAR
jgi:UDP:flavonoid glycosyltransferase YjiC (YdhE family)